MPDMNTIMNNPAFLAFRAAKGTEKKQDDQAAEQPSVKEVSVKEEGKNNSITVKNEE